MASSRDKTARKVECLLIPWSIRIRLRSLPSHTVESSLLGNGRLGQSVWGVTGLYPPLVSMIERLSIGTV